MTNIVLADHFSFPTWNGAALMEPVSAITIGVVLVVLIFCIEGYLTSDNRHKRWEASLEQQERDKRRAHEMNVERERTMRAQTTYPWPDPNKDGE